MLGKNRAKAVSNFLTHSLFCALCLSRRLLAAGCGDRSR